MTRNKKLLKRQVHSIKNEGLKAKVVDQLKIIRDGLAKEGTETKEMFKTYARYTQGEASAEEMQAANQQFRDLLSTMGLGVLVILPFAPLTIPALVKIGRKFGIDIIPSSFRED